MFDLYTFYRDKKWRKLLEQIKIDRLNDEGQLICEYCGKPMLKAYDIIGHHKTELTEENVNDFNISLNPENISLVHHRCHNYIHNKLGYSSRKIYLVYGAPLSGKSTWVKDSMSHGDLIIDLDNIWQCVSGCERYVKPNRLKSIVFKIRDTLLESVRYRAGKWSNAYIIGGYPIQSERERLCKELGAQEIFIDTTREECVERLLNQDDREKEEWKRYIDEWFDRYIPPSQSE